jgi:predicted nucleic acid-binding protein
MASKVFIDANILLDFTLKRADYNKAKKLIELVVIGKVQGYVTPSIVHIVGYWLTKEYGAKKAKEILLTLLVEIKVIDISHTNTLTALHSKINDIEDALQYYAALHHKLDYFLSRDAKLMKEGTAVLPIISIEDYMEIIE